MPSKRNSSHDREEVARSETGGQGLKAVGQGNVRPVVLNTFLLKNF